MIRVCFVPVVGSGTRIDTRRPKYFGTGELPTPIAWAGTDYGFEPWFALSADLDAPSLAFLQAQPDAFVVPADFDALLTAGQVTATQAALEVMNMPADWVTTALDWRTVVRTTLGVFRFMARFAVVFTQQTGTTLPIFTGGVDLTRTFSSLSPAVRTAITTTADELAIDRTGITGTSTLRQILNAIGLQARTQAQGVGSLVV